MKRQTVKLNGNTGSLVNHIYGNNATAPEVGKGATILHYSDRSACEVISVSDDGKTVVLEGCNAIRTDNNGMSDSQEYRYELDGYQFTIVWRNGAWRREVKEIWFTDAANEMTFDERANCFEPETNRLMLIDGMTFIKKSFPKINIIFGFKQAYHDYSF